MGERKQIQEYELNILHLRGNGGFASAAKVAGMNGSAAALHFDPRAGRWAGRDGPCFIAANAEATSPAAA